MAGGIEPRMIGLADREAAIRFLSRDALSNLFLLDLTARLGDPPEPGESQTEIVGAWRGGEIVGMAGLRPSVVFDAEAGTDVVEAICPYLEGLSVALVKSFAPAVDELWNHLAKRRPRRAM